MEKRLVRILSLIIEHGYQIVETQNDYELNCGKNFFGIEQSDVQELVKLGYLDNNLAATEKAKELF